MSFIEKIEIKLKNKKDEIARHCKFFCFKVQYCIHSLLQSLNKLKFWLKLIFVLLNHQFLQIPENVESFFDLFYLSAQYFAAFFANRESQKMATFFHLTQFVHSAAFLDDLPVTQTRRAAAKNQKRKRKI